MPERLISKYWGALGIASVLCLAAVPAHAGFQWVSPDESAGVQSAPLPPAYASPPVVIGGSSRTVNNARATGKGAVADDVISPVIIVGAPPAAAKAEPKAGSSLSFDGISSDGQQAVAEPSLPVSSSSSQAQTSPSDQGMVMGSAPHSLGTMGGNDLDVPAASANTAPAATMATETSSNSGDVVRGFAKSVPLAVALRQILPGGYSFTIDQNVDMGTLVSFKGGRAWRDTLRDSLVPVGLVMHEQGQVVVISYASERAMTDRVASAGAAPAELPPGEMAIAPQSILPSDSPMQPAMTAAPSPSRDVAAMPAAMSGAPHMASAAMPSDIHGRYNWAAERGDSLRKVLAEWSNRVHVEFNWMAEYDYPLEASFGFNGTFEEAVRDLLTGFEEAHPQPVAELHSNPSIGQMVLIVQTRGNTNTD